MDQLTHFLFLGTTNFSGFAQREHALVMTLAARGFRVTYIEGMPSFAAKVRHVVRSSFSPHAVERGADALAVPPTLKILTPPMVPTFSRSSLTPAFDKFLFRRWFRNIEMRQHFPKTILIVSLPHWWTGFLAPEMMKEAFVVYDKCDSLLVPSRNAKTLQTMEEAERRLIEAAGLVTYSADEMKSELDNFGITSKSLFLPNAVSNEFIREAENSTAIVHDRKRIGFIGAVDERWVDVELIMRSLKTLQTAEHIFVGTVSPSLQRKFSAYDNATFTGALPHREVARLLKSFDVATIPFLRNEITRVVNPLKLYEYCSAGIPIVAIATAELRHYAGLVSLAESPDEYVSLLQYTLNSTAHEARDSRVAFARVNTWDQRIDVLLNALDRATN